ncbi:hypothetical protein Taro_055007 [Colocasia esculenta]|uniref:UspA domain-containing protein n=1 Tax=Colocasia esculenta TaxID=4460 RepID=A0A843XSC9_COLES|nr:hypothetical protein [Colocasia esculenta]
MPCGDVDSAVRGRHGPVSTIPPLQIRLQICLIERKKKHPPVSSTAPGFQKPLPVRAAHNIPAPSLPVKTSSTPDARHPPPIPPSPAKEKIFPVFGFPIPVVFYFAWLLAKGMAGDPARARQGRKIVVAVDEGEESMYALSWCLDNVAGAGDTLVLLHAMPPRVVYTAMDGTGYLFSSDIIATMEKHGRLVADAVIEKARGACRRVQNVRSRRYREGAVINMGDAVCRQKAIELLQAFNDVPSGLFPFEDVEEVGYNPNSGFVCLRQKKARNHFFRKIGHLVSYAFKVTAVVEDGRIRHLSGMRDPRDVICETVEKVGADILVLGSHGYGLIKRYTLSSVTTPIN